MSLCHESIRETDSFPPLLCSLCTRAVTPLILLHALFCIWHAEKRCDVYCYSQWKPTAIAMRDNYETNHAGINYNVCPYLHYMYLPASSDERKKYINVHSEDFTSYLLWISPVWHKMWIVIEGLLSLWVRWPTPVVEAPSKAVYSSVGTESIVLCSLGVDLSANDFSTARHLGETVAVQCCNWICCIVCLPIRTDWCSCLHGAHLGPAFYEQFAQEKKHTQTSLHTLLSGDRVCIGCLASWRAFRARTR